MKDPVPYNEYFVHKSKHVPRSEKVNTPQQYTMNVPGRKTNVYSQNEIYGSQYTGDHYNRTYLPHIAQNAKNKTMDKRRVKKKTESDQYGDFYSPRQEYTGRVQYDINPEYIPPPNPREQRYQANTNSAPVNPLNQAFSTVNMQRTHALPPISPPARSTVSYSQPPGSRERDTFHLPEIHAIDMNITCADYSTVNIYRGRDGSYQYSSFPQQIHSLSVPDIREVNVRLRARDGSVSNFTAKPTSRYE